MKEKINKFITHKFLPVFSVVILILFSICLYSYGVTDVTYTYNDTEYNVTLNGTINEFDYILLRVSFKNNIFRYELLLSNSPMIIKYVNDVYKYRSSDGSDFYYYNSYTTTNFSTLDDLNDSLSNLNITDLNSMNKNSYGYNFTSLEGATKDCSTWSYGNYNLYDENGNILFLLAPTSYQIPTIQEAKELTGVMKGTMKVTVPVGLILLGIGLVIYLTRLVILRIR